jgi:hypothetical protein
VEPIDTLDVRAWLAGWFDVSPDAVRRRAHGGLSWDADGIAGPVRISKASQRDHTWHQLVAWTDDGRVARVTYGRRTHVDWGRETGDDD